MVNSSEIQRLYNNLYKEIRRYIWDFTTVAALADLEVAVYETCQDIDKVKTHFYRLKPCLFEVCIKDEDLDKAVKSFETMLSNAGSIFVKLNQVNEVVQQ